MKDYIKTSNSLVNAEDLSLKIYSTVAAMNNDIANISSDEVVLVQGSALYQKSNGSMVDITSPVVPVASAGYIGDIVAYYGNTNPDPTTFLVCDGSTFSSSDFPELYNILGTNTTPDLTGIGLKGTPNGGTVRTRCAESCFPAHTHTGKLRSHAHTLADTHCHMFPSSHLEIPSINCYYQWCCIGTCTNCGFAWANYSSTYQNTLLTQRAVYNLRCTWAKCICTGTYSGCCASGAVSNTRGSTETKGKTKTVLYLIRGKE